MVAEGFFEFAASLVAEGFFEFAASLVTEGFFEFAVALALAAAAYYENVYNRRSESIYK